MKRSRVLILFASLLTIFAAITIQKLFKSNPKTIAQTLLAKADIEVNGSRPWDMTVRNDHLYARVLSEGSLGLGESYMQGWWDCQSLDQFFYKIARSQVITQTPYTLNTILGYIKSKIMNLQSKTRAFQVGEQHYDLGDDLFKAILDKHMQYSCGYWKDATNLDQAQENKLALICKKLYLKPGMKVLDIGCGWGGLAHYMAKNYGVSVVGVTISKEQARYAQEWNKNLPVEIRLQDYRDLHETFDRIVSVGMFEHVGYKNYSTFMQTAQRLCKR